MSRIDQAVADALRRTTVDAALQRAQSRISDAAALSFRPTPDAGQSGATQSARAAQGSDGVEIGDQARNAAASLGRIDRILVDIRGALARATSDAQALGATNRSLQQRVNTTLASVNRLADAPSLNAARELGRATPVADGETRAVSYQLTNIHAGVNKAVVTAAPLGAGESQDVTVQITASAQTAALRLSFGGSSLDLNGAQAAGPTAGFLIEIGGGRGAEFPALTSATGARHGDSVRLFFTSGSSLANIRDTINSFANLTRVSATLSGPTGIRLSSRLYGSHDFVNVKVLNFGNAVGAGVFQYRADDNYRADVSSGVSFASAANPVVDRGQDIQARINGVDGTGHGLSLTSFAGSALQAYIEFTPDRAQHTGLFRAFTITGVALPSPLSAPGDGLNGIGGKPSKTELAALLPDPLSFDAGDPPDDFPGRRLNLVG